MNNLYFDFCCCEHFLFSIEHYLLTLNPSEKCRVHHCGGCRSCESATSLILLRFLKVFFLVFEGESSILSCLSWKFEIPSRRYGNFWVQSCNLGCEVLNSTWMWESFWVKSCKCRSESFEFNMKVREYFSWKLQFRGWKFLNSSRKLLNSSWNVPSFLGWKFVEYRHRKMRRSSGGRGWTSSTMRKWAYASSDSGGWPVYRHTLGLVLVKLGRLS